MMPDDKNPIRRCPHCRAGWVVLLVSSRRCDQCHGTGLDLNDARLSVSIQSLNTLVRTRKLLGKYGIDTLGELIRAVAADRFTGADALPPSCFGDVCRIFNDLRLPHLLVHLKQILSSVEHKP